MNPLAWLIAVLLGGIALLSNAPSWLVVILGISLSIAIIIFLVLYIYFAFKSPDLLRSEKFYLAKLAIEKSIRGDNLIGLVDPNVEENTKVLEAKATVPNQEDVK